MTPNILIVDKKWYIARPSLAKWFGVSVPAIKQYEKKERYDEPLEYVDNKEWGIEGDTIYYDFKYAIEWHRRSVLTKHSSTDTKHNNDLIYDGGEIDEKNAVVARNVEDAKAKKLDREKKEIELKILKGDYIHIDEVDAREAATGAILASGLQNMKEVFPSIAHNKSKQEIAQIFDESTERTMGSILDAIKKRNSDKLYNLVHTVVKDTKQLTKALKCLKM